MIKINLLKNYDSSVGGMQSAGGITYGEVKEEGKGGALIKVVMLLIGPFVLNHLESETINKKFRRVENAQQQLSQLNRQIARVGDAVEIVSRYEKEKKKIEERVNVVKSLAEYRLREAIVLDQVKKLIPERTWIKNLKIDGDQVSIQGTSFTDDDIALFVDQIEESSVFADVIFTTSQADDAGSSNWKSFQLSAQLEEI